MNRFLLLVGEYESKLREHGTVERGTAEADQMLAAADEIEPLIVDYAFRVMDRRPGTRYSDSQGVVKHRAAAMVMAAFHLPGMRRCFHTVTIQPLLALMPLRVVVCRSCAGQGHEFPTVVPADRCDWCDAEVLDNQFAPITIRYNHLTAIGDACGECAPEFWAAYSQEGEPE